MIVMLFFFIISISIPTAFSAFEFEFFSKWTPITFVIFSLSSSYDRKKS